MSSVEYKFSDSDLEKNELNTNARGGTELMQERLHGTLSKDLLDKFQIIPSRVRDLDPDRIPVLWLHDLPDDPESKHLQDSILRKRFKHIVAVSDWQMQMYNLISGVPYSQCSVIKNAIYPIQMGEKQYDGTVRLIYHTTPHRGLAILVPVFERLAEEFDNIQLDVYSSFSIYGWAERDKPFEELFDRCKAHPKINYFGAVSNEEIRDVLKESHIFAYPSIWPETSCIAAIEAMSAKNIVVCPNYAALPETMGGFGDMYQWSEDPNAHAARFYNVLRGAIMTISEDGPNQTRLNFQKAYCDTMFNWQVRSKQWEAMLNSLLPQE
jgi:glycosyltransferase involved in cell wall biosynthesis